MREYDLSGEWMAGASPDAMSERMLLPQTTAQAHISNMESRPQTGYLTERYPYLGRLYLKKWVYLQPEEVGRPVFLCLERTRMTRVWVNGTEAGSNDSLTTPHRYELTDYIQSSDVELLIEVDNSHYPISGGHLTSPDTQTNWNGITGEITLTVYDEVWFEHVRTDYRCASGQHQVQFRCVLCNKRSTHSDMIKITPVFLKRLSEEKKVELQPLKLAAQDCQISLEQGRKEYEAVYTFEEDPVLWSEYTPMLYVFRIELSDGTDYEVETGLREFTADGHFFYINGNRTMLRGKHDAMLFPIEGAAPTTLEAWLRVMGTAREYGVNHYRFHTCCPPKAAFAAADLLGIYMEPELPFWGTVTEPGEEGHDEKAWQYLIKEGLRMLETYGNHPSFCMMSMGNELWGSTRRIGEAIMTFRRADNRHLYTQGSNNYQFIPQVLPQEDFYVGVRLAPSDEQGTNDRLIRGSYACCDAPMGHVQTREPDTRMNYDHAIMPEDGRWIPQLPVVLHEIGQYEMYPDYRQIPSFTGVLAPENLVTFRKRLQEKGMGDEAEEFFYNSGMLAVQCYEEELEAAHRSEYVAGYQILDLQDYTGQGTALVGILDAFMENKGLISADEWRNYCSDSVLLAQFDGYCVVSGSEFTWDMALSHYRWLQPAGEDWQISWELDMDGDTITKGIIPLGQSGCGLLRAGSVTCTLPAVEQPAVLELALALPMTGAEKIYRLWLYPDNHEFCLREGAIGERGEAYVTSSQEEATRYFEEGRRVLYIEENPKDSLPAMYCTNFWNYPMFRSICEAKGVAAPVGTLGLLIRNTHPALAQFPCETYATPQWYVVVEHSRLATLPKWSSPVDRPLVQVIDNVERNDRLGILYEQRNERGGLMLTTTTELFKIQDCAQGRQYAKSLCDYIRGKHLGRGLYTSMLMLMLCIVMGLTGCGRAAVVDAAQLPQTQLNTQEELQTMEAAQMRDGRELISEDVTDDMYARATAYQGTDETRLAAVMRKAQRGEPVTIAVIGGSITEGYKSSATERCYASLLDEWWNQRFPDAPLQYINAGIGGTSSYLGVHRVQEDVLQYNADLVVVEFSVNDGSSAFFKKSYDNLVRRILNDKNQPAVMLLFTTQEDGTNAQEIDALIGFKYHLPMVSYANAILPQIEAGILSWQDISPDTVHPNDRGHAIIGELLARYLDSVYDRLDELDTQVTPFREKPMSIQSYQEAYIADAASIEPVSMGSFEVKEVNPYYPNDWHTDTGEVPIEFEIEAASIGIAYERSTEDGYGQYDVYVDGKLIKTLDGNFTDGWGSTFDTQEVLSTRQKAKHRVRIERNPESTGNCFTIVGLLID